MNYLQQFATSWIFYWTLRGFHYLI